MRLRNTILSLSLLMVASLPVKADVNVVTSIKPVHSLAASIMKGTGEPSLIVDGVASPHNFSMKPSQAQMLENADIVFWIGHDLEAFLVRPIKTTGANAQSIELMETPGLALLDFREGGAFAGGHDHGDHDDHGDHGNEHHDEHADEHDDEHHDEHAEHGRDEHDHGDEHHDEHAEEHHDDHGDEHHDEHADGGHDGHDHGAHDGEDPHLWLDPVNAKLMAARIAEALKAADPEHSDLYAANERALQADLDALIAEVNGIVTPVRGKGFIVFHDAYRYFETRFGVDAVGSLTVNPEVLPGAERLSEIKDTASDLKVACIFAEPQFPSRLIEVVREGTEMNVGVLDPLGSLQDKGPGQYAALIRNMASSMRDCLS